MRYQAGDKDLVAEYFTAMGVPTIGTDFDVPYDDWMKVREEFFEAATEWKRSKMVTPKKHQPPLGTIGPLSQKYLSNITRMFQRHGGGSEQHLKALRAYETYQYGMVINGDKPCENRIAHLHGKD